MAWNPDEPMMIATAADDDYNPIVLVWDLRNASQPTGQFQGHSASVTSIAWCQKDSDLLMSCGKDKRTVTLVNNVIYTEKCFHQIYILNIF